MAEGIGDAVGTHPKHSKKLVRIDPGINEQIVAMAEELDITPGELVEEAVVFYLRSSRAELMRRVQERLDALFAKVDAAYAGELSQEGQDG